MPRLDFGLALVALSAASAAAEEIQCRAQISYACADVCETGVGPADLTLDLAGGAATFCRGARCDGGRLETVEGAGQWNDEPYAVFRARGEKPEWSLVGVLLPDRRTFHALSDELGMIVGTCE